MVDGTKAAIYCRISKDSTERGEGVGRQEQDCRALAKRLGLEVAAVFVDNDISASTKAKKPRPQYDEMIRRARLGEFGAILAYSTDRLTRRMTELVPFVAWVAERGVRFVTVDGDDTAGDRGELTLHIKGSVAQDEAKNISRRVLRQKQQAAEEGKFRGGPRPYGYDKKGLKVIEREAEVIRYATKAVLSGRSLAALSKELNAAGKKTSRGTEWSRHSLRDVLLRPRNAGFVSLGRVRVDVRKGAKAQWPAIVTEDEFDAVTRVLVDPARRTTLTTASSHLGSGIYSCGHCHSVMRSFSVPRRNTKGETYKRPAYRCQERGHLTVMAEPTDDYVRGVVAEMVRDPRIVEAMTSGEGDLMQAERERRRVLALRLEQTEADYDDHLIDARRYNAKTAKITEEMSRIEARLADAAQAATVLPIFSTMDPGQAFLDAPIDVQRAVLRAVLAVEVQPFVGGRGSAWSSERLKLQPVV